MRRVGDVEALTRLLRIPALRESACVVSVDDFEVRRAEASDHLLVKALHFPLAGKETHPGDIVHIRHTISFAPRPIESKRCLAVHVRREEPDHY